MKTYIIAFATILLSLPAFGQTLERQVIGAAGTSSSTANMQISYTVGEPAVTTLSGGSIVLTQGFQQPDEDVTGIQSPEVLVEYNVYPNPTTDQLNIRLFSEKPLIVQIQLLDISGKKVDNICQSASFSGEWRGEIDLSNLPQGQYLLWIGQESTGKYTTLQIQKL